MENANTESTAPQSTTESPEAAAAEQAAKALEEMFAACRQQITVEIPEDVVKEEQESLVQRYAKEARVPGFRSLPLGDTKSVAVPGAARAEQHASRSSRNAGVAVLMIHLQRAYCAHRTLSA